MTESLRLKTARLELVAATRDIIRAERYTADAFPSLLHAVVPPEWPPPLNDEESLNLTVQALTANPEAAGWFTWYFLLVVPDGSRVAIGNGGFKGRPNMEGTVEVGYSLLEKFQRNGYAAEAIGELIEWAFRHEEVKRIAAETYPHLRNSIRVLEKCGFNYVGQGSDILIIRFELTREEFTQVYSKK